MRYMWTVSLSWSFARPSWNTWSWFIWQFTKLFPQVYSITAPFLLFWSILLWWPSMIQQSMITQILFLLSLRKSFFIFILLRWSWKLLEWDLSLARIPISETLGTSLISWSWSRVGQLSSRALIRSSLVIFMITTIMSRKRKASVFRAWGPSGF